MDFVFADDSRQKTPSRSDMGGLVGIGGIYINGQSLRSLERELDVLCKDVGFPKGEQFKYSPGKKESFMKRQLIGQARIDFYRSLFEIALNHGATACVVAEDVTRSPARRASKNHEHDVTSLFLERADWGFDKNGTDGVVVIAKPSGGTRDEGKFLADCLSILEDGTEFTDLATIPLPVLTAPAQHIRLLQLADVVTSCTLARVAGETTYSPTVFEMMKPLLRSDGQRVGGVGLKLHPDYNFANLYYWILGDSHVHKGNQGWPLPMENFPYYDDAGE